MPKIEEYEEGGTGKFGRILNGIAEFITNLPRALIVVGMVLSLSGVGVAGYFNGAEHVEEEKQLVTSDLEERIRKLEIWNLALREQIRNLFISIGKDANKTEFEGFLLDVGSGKITPLEPEGK